MTERPTEPPTEPEIVVMPDPGDIVFDERGTPFLTWSEYPTYEGGRVHLHKGWVLSCLDSSNGVEDHFIGGRLEDMDAALENARKWIQEHVEEGNWPPGRLLDAEGPAHDA